MFESYNFLPTALAITGTLLVVELITVNLYDYKVHAAVILSFSIASYFAEESNANDIYQLGESMGKVSVAGEIENEA